MEKKINVEMVKIIMPVKYSHRTGKIDGLKGDLCKV